MERTTARWLLLSWMCLAPGAWAGETVPAPADLATGIEIADVQITGRIDGQQLALSLDFEAVTTLAHRQMVLVQGEAALESLDKPGAGTRLDYDLGRTAYTLALAQAGRHHVTAAFAARPQAEPNSPWQQATLQVPAGRVRHVELRSDRPDLEVQLPGAVRVQRQVEQGELVIRAILGPGQALVVQWKPQVQLAGAKLVLSSVANTIVDVRAGLVHLDAVFDFQVSQGKIEVLTFRVPDPLSITALDGAHIRQWSLADANAADGPRRLVVELSRPQEKDYRLHILAEVRTDPLPAKVEVPAIEPMDGIRTSGHLAVGTNSALQLVVLESSGLTQIDGAVFPRVATQGPQDRPIPQGKAFFYVYAGSTYRLRLSVDDIVPSYDVAGRFAAKIREDDLVVDAELELDVRDAPIPQLEIVVPAGLTVASVDGNQVEDYHVSEAPAADQPTTVRTVFAEPVMGRTLVHLRLELGHGPLDQRQTIRAVQVTGAKVQRGYVVVAPDAGIEISEPLAENLREVHTASVPLRVAQAQFAYRYRQADWALGLMARRKPPGVTAEVFHLESIGEALAYGSAVVNYLITGSPVDELSVGLPEGLDNVEFVGRDVRRWVRQENLWVVKLTRKVIGDYNLAVTYTQRYGPGRPIHLGALHCQGVQTQTGYVVVTSYLDLNLQTTPSQGTGDQGLLAIAMDELPGDYRLLTSSPILAAYKYVTEPHAAMLSIDPCRRSGLLPVVLDIAAQETRLAVRPDGRVESVTTVRYKVKNTTGQFLSLTMSQGTRVWAVSLIEPKPGGGEQSTRLAASRDPDSGRLLVPLRRQANPNDPSTIELEYGQVHEAGGWWRRRVDLAAPSSSVPMTYADWQVTAPKEWAITAAGGTMQAPPHPDTRAGLAWVLSRVGQEWALSLGRWVGQPLVWVMGAMVSALAALCLLLRRGWLPELALAGLLGAAVWVGVGAATYGRLERPAPATSLTYVQAVNADPNRPLQVSADLVPAWREGLPAADAIGVPLVLAAAVACAVLRRGRCRTAVAAGVAALAYLAADVPATWPGLEALMTWGLPVALAVWFAYGAMARRHRLATGPVPVTSVLLIPALVAGASMLAGCAGPGPAIQSMAGHPMIERIECRLCAGADSMELRYKLRVSADAPCRLGLLDESAVLVSTPKPGPHVTLHPEEGRQVVCMDRAGLYDVEATFLVALPPAGEDQQRRFELPLPVALTNRISLVVPDANVLIDAPQAVRLTGGEHENQTTVEATFTPGEPARFTWRPRERQASKEEVRSYAQDMALASLTSGLLQVFHAVRLQIAQGQIDTLKLGITEGQTVTSVSAPHSGAWRFDPATHQLEVRLTQPVTGVYAFALVTQSANASAPYDVHLEPLVVCDALQQHSAMGLAADSSVYVRVDQHPAAMNAQDFIRDAGDLIKAVPGLSADQITQAFRFDAAGGAVTGRVFAVPSEVRSEETARFNVEDERLVYNSQWVIEIAKAGRFDVDLLMPEGFDIDTLAAEQVSHWDESAEAGQRQVRVHFKRKLTGSVTLNLALSRPVTQMPERVTVPHIMVADVLKHTGTLVVSSEQGVRLSVQSREGLSEVDPAELGQPSQGLLAFRLLRPDWQLHLQTEVVQPRVTVQTLHVAKVTDGLVRHLHSLRYRLFHAGTKTLELILPSDAAGVTIVGPGIARREQVGQGTWRIELADKVYDQPYLLKVIYETRYDPANGTLPLEPVRCQGADLQQGYTVVSATDRVELSVEAVDPALRPAEARTIPAYFGAGDLAGVALCYRSTSPEQRLTVRARRHAVAEQIGAEVRRTDIATVVTETGQTITRVVLTLRVGAQRHLQTTLPEGAAIWSLAVDGQAAQPSLRTNAGGSNVVLVPLPQQASDDAVVDMVYVVQLPWIQGRTGMDRWPGPHRLSGPRFDLPLKQITWQVYVPEGFVYGDFGGTLTMDRDVEASARVRRYNVQAYEQQVLESNSANDRFAQQQQRLAHDLAQQGLQTAARRALAKGYNFSFSNRALNEDIRVDLDNLVRQQAKVGLVSARGRLRQQTSGEAQTQTDGVGPAEGQGPSFSQQQAERIESSLGQADSENLELITRRIIQTQEAAEGSVAQLQITMPLCGQMLRFESPLQVEPAAEMAVAFSAKRQQMRRLDPNLWYGAGLFAGLLAAGSAVGLARRQWDRIHEILAPVPSPAQPVEPARHSGEHGRDDQVSAQELI